MSNWHETSQHNDFLWSKANAKAVIFLLSDILPDNMHSDESFSLYSVHFNILSGWKNKTVSSMLTEILEWNMKACKCSRVSHYLGLFAWQLFCILQFIENCISIFKNVSILWELHECIQNILDTVSSLPTHHHCIGQTFKSPCQCHIFFLFVIEPNSAAMTTWTYHLQHLQLIRRKTSN